MQRDLYAAFIDMEKAYDRVPRKAIWKSLRNKGVTESYIRIVSSVQRSSNEGEKWSRDFEEFLSRKVSRMCTTTISHGNIDRPYAER